MRMLWLFVVGCAWGLRSGTNPLSAHFITNVASACEDAVRGETPEESSELRDATVIECITNLDVFNVNGIDKMLEIARHLANTANKSPAPVPAILVDEEENPSSTETAIQATVPSEAKRQTGISRPVKEAFQKMISDPQIVYEKLKEHEEPVQGVVLMLKLATIIELLGLEDKSLKFITALHSPTPSEIAEAVRIAGLCPEPVRSFFTIKLTFNSPDLKKAPRDGDFFNDDDIRTFAEAPCMETQLLKVIKSGALNCRHAQALIPAKLSQSVNNKLAAKLVQCFFGLVTSDASILLKEVLKSPLKAKFLELAVPVAEYSVRNGARFVSILFTLGFGDVADRILINLRDMLDKKTMSKEEAEKLLKSAVNWPRESFAKLYPNFPDKVLPNSGLHWRPSHGAFSLEGLFRMVECLRAAKESPVSVLVVFSEISNFKESKKDINSKLAESECDLMKFLLAAFPPGVAFFTQVDAHRAMFAFFAPAIVTCTPYVQEPSQKEVLIAALPTVFSDLRYKEADKKLADKVEKSFEKLVKDVDCKVAVRAVTNYYELARNNYNLLNLKFDFSAEEIAKRLLDCRGTWLDKEEQRQVESLEAWKKLAETEAKTPSKLLQVNHSGSKTFKALDKWMSQSQKRLPKS